MLLSFYGRTRSFRNQRCDERRTRSSGSVIKGLTRPQHVFGVRFLSLNVVRFLSLNAVSFLCVIVETVVFLVSFFFLFIIILLLCAVFCFILLLLFFVLFFFWGGG